ncbi:MerR family transcriptional regulator [bacterium]|nr:MerR family transcriptional regulator [bacterium]
MAGKPDYPSKLYYSISEVAGITGIKAHVLRYWEGEFPSLKPRKTRTGSRRYRAPDIDEIFAIKELLYEQGFKIAGARKALREQRKAKPAEAEIPAQTQMTLGFESMSDPERLAYLKAELGEILRLVRELKAETAPTAPKAMKGEG